jgi:hypothetical protein
MAMYRSIVMADSVIIDTLIGKSGECIASNVPKQLDVPVIP